MAKYTVTHFCDHEVEYQLVGPHKERDRKIAWLEGQNCPDCRKAEFNAANAQAAAQVTDADLPELNGSEKQVNWARTIRAQKAPKIREILAHTVAAYQKDDMAAAVAMVERVAYQVLDNAEARYWIDSREDRPLELLETVLMDLERNKELTLDEVAAISTTMEVAKGDQS
jgi:Ni,Fe-hydrogenase I small subunit